MARPRNIMIRPERPDDHPAVFELNLRTFNRPMEAQLVERLRPNVRPLVSLVAIAEEQVVGHVLFTPARLEAPHRRLAMGIGPMAVRPEMQGQGVGSRLLQVGLDACRIAAMDVVFVLGHPEFYRRFGFKLAQPLGLTFFREDAGYPLLVTEIRPGSLRDLRGMVQFPVEPPSDQRMAKAVS